MLVRIFAATSLLFIFAQSASVQAENLEHLNQMLANKQCLKCDLRSSGLVFADLSRFDLSGSDFSDANLSRANLTGANLRNANLSGVSLLGANLSGADLTGANLTGADLNSANLSRAKLTNANLTNADLRYAYLVNIDLQGATLDNAYLKGAIGIPVSIGKPTDFYVWGVEEARKGNHKEAIAQFNQSLVIDPKFAFSYLGRAISRKQIGDVGGALQDSVQAQNLFTEQKNTEGAKVSQDLTQALQNPPGSDSGGFGDVINVVGSILLKFIMR